MQYTKMKIIDCKNFCGFNRYPIVDFFGQHNSVIYLDVIFDVCLIVCLLMHTINITKNVIVIFVGLRKVKKLNNDSY